MSGIYIKDMEMPTSPVLFCIHPDGKVFADLEGRWREYQAVPIPQHGRLRMTDYVDRDALIADIERSWDWDSIDGITATTVLKQTISDIKNYPAADVVDRKALRDALYEADAITFKGLAILDNFPAADVRLEAYGHGDGEDPSHPFADDVMMGESHE